LMDLHQVMREQLAPDFSPLLQELHEQELLKFSVHGSSSRKSRLKEYNKNAVFLRGHGATNKAHIYEMLSGVEVMDVLHVNDSAVVLFHSRSEAVQSCDVIKNKFGPNVRVDLICPLKQTSPVSQASREPPKSVLSDPSVIRQVVDIMTKVRCPIVVRFASGVVDLYPGGNYPVLTVSVNPQTVYHLGPLFSDPTVPKVVETLEWDDASKVLTTLCSHGVRARGMFDIGSAYRARDYLSRGQSMANAPRLTISAILTNMGIGVESHSTTAEDEMNRVLTTYLYFQETMPTWALDYLGARARVETDIAAGHHQAQAQVCSEKLRDLYERSCVHVKPLRFCPDLYRRLKAEVKHMGPCKIWVLSNCALVQAGDPEGVRACLDHLQGPDFQHVVPSKVKAVDTDFVPTSRKAPKTQVDQTRLQREGMTSHLENLESLGYGNIIVACQTSA